MYFVGLYCIIITMSSAKNKKLVQVGYTGVIYWTRYWILRHLEKRTKWTTDYKKLPNNDCAPWTYRCDRVQRNGSDIFSWFYPVSLRTYLIISLLRQQLSLTSSFQFIMYQPFHNSTAVYISLRYQHRNRITQKRQSKWYMTFNST